MRNCLMNLASVVLLLILAAAATGTAEPADSLPGWTLLWSDEFDGTNSYQVSEDARWAVHTHQSFMQPPQYRLVTLPDHDEVAVLEDNRALIDALDGDAPIRTRDSVHDSVAAGSCAAPMRSADDRFHPSVAWTRLITRPSGTNVHAAARPV